MSKPRIELKVGVFVFAGLVLLAIVAMLLSKGMNIFASTMELRLRCASVAGVKTGASVSLAGVPVGRVSGVELGSEGTNVIIHVKILRKYPIHADARFEIEQSGFLGDQYVAIYPGLNQGKILADGDEVICRVPFNLKETMGKATETLSSIGLATTNVNAVVSDVRRIVLTEERLSRLGAAIDHFEQLTLDARSAISNLNALVVSNTSPATLLISNLHQVSSELVPFTENLNSIVTNNQDEIAIVLKNVEIASAGLTNLMNELQHGRGVAARLIHSEQLADDLDSIAKNLSITASNLNRRGLWGILWAKKTPQTNETNFEVLRSPRDPLYQ